MHDGWLKGFRAGKAQGFLVKSAEGAPLDIQGSIGQTSPIALCLLKAPPTVALAMVEVSPLATVP